MITGIILMLVAAILFIGGCGVALLVVGGNMMSTNSGGFEDGKIALIGIGAAIGGVFLAIHAMTFF